MLSVSTQRMVSSQITDHTHAHTLMTSLHNLLEIPEWILQNWIFMKMSCTPPNCCPWFPRRPSYNIHLLWRHRHLINIKYQMSRTGRIYSFNKDLYTSEEVKISKESCFFNLCNLESFLATREGYCFLVKSNNASFGWPGSRIGRQLVGPNPDTLPFVTRPLHHCSGRLKRAVAEQSRFRVSV